MMGVCMENLLKNFEIGGAIFIFILGAIMHFMFDLSGRLKIVGLFTPVNESVWEHLKMVLWPSLIYSVLEYSIFKSHVNNFWFSKAAGIYTAMIVIIVIFYTYTAFTGHSILAVDILTFAAAIAAAQFISYKIMLSKDLSPWINRLSCPLIALLIFIFILFTFCPPHLPLFKNSIDGTYGV
jgi:hypothetical protein